MKELTSLYKTPPGAILKLPSYHAPGGPLISVMLLCAWSASPSSAIYISKPRILRSSLPGVTASRSVHVTLAAARLGDTAAFHKLRRDLTLEGRLHSEEVGGCQRPAGQQPAFYLAVCQAHLVPGVVLVDCPGILHQLVIQPGC